MKHLNIVQYKTGTQLFTLRIWLEEVDNGRFEMRGTIKHVLSGETHNFREMVALEKFIEQTMTETGVPRLYADRPANPIKRQGHALRQGRKPAQFCGRR
jgi:hypothetical protein